MRAPLNIEIINKDNKVLANADFHWEGFTSSTIILLKDIIRCYSEIERKRVNNDILYAIRLLESTGAGLPDDECDYYIENVDMFLACNDVLEEGCGVIAISPDGIQKTRENENVRVTLNIDTLIVNFGSIYKYANEDTLSEDLMRLNGSTVADYSVEVLDFDFSKMSFEDVYTFGDIHDWDNDIIYIDNTNNYFWAIE